MRLTVDIDPESGFCYGVIRAISKAEDYLASHRSLRSLGAIVHNSLELDRLRARGLEIIGLEDMERLPAGEVVLIRAHGEPPQTYQTARRLGLELIDCTCPAVLQLQGKVRETFARMEAIGGQVIIFGKRGHAEVNGLVGQTGGQAKVVGGVEDIEGIDFDRPIALFSQTTKDPEEYRLLAEQIRSRARSSVDVYDTICRRVSQRYNSLKEFAVSHSVVLFVSGRDSSNGKVLYDLCHQANPRCHLVEQISDIVPQWFRDGDTVGICGATSTPKWQLEEAAARTASMQTIC